MADKEAKTEEKEMTKEELIKNLSDDLKSEMARRDKREAFDRILCAVVASGAYSGIEDILDQTSAILYGRQQLIDRGEI